MRRGHGEARRFARGDPVSLRSIRRGIAKRELPSMRCDDGCGRCCGMVPVTAAEYARVIAYAREHGIEPVIQGITCPFWQGGKCSVYEVRPLVCKLMGHVPELTCPRGYNVNVGSDRGRKLVRQNGQPSTCLHQALEDFGLVTDWAEEVRSAFDKEVPHHALEKYGSL